MKNPRDDRGMLSRLPEDERYWADLTDLIVGDAASGLVARRDDRREWWFTMASLSNVLATGAVAAVVALLYLLPTPAVGLDTVQVADPFGLAPRDAFATPLLKADVPPMVVALVWDATERMP